jgi:hypothetical protein
MNGIHLHFLGTLLHDGITAALPMPDTNFLLPTSYFLLPTSYFKLQVCYTLADDI